MIEAVRIEQAGVLMIKISIPGETDIYQSFTGDGRADAATRYEHAIRKNRLSSILCRWLKQRRHALECDYDKAEIAYRLLVMVNYTSQFNYIKLCQMVQSKRAEFDQLRPRPQSKHLPYYLKNILPLLKECNEALTTAGL